MNQSPGYTVYLLTVWEEQEPGLESVWRFRLEDPSTGRQRGFANLKALVAALEGIIGPGEEISSEDLRV